MNIRNRRRLHNLNTLRLMRRVMEESASYLQTTTREAAQMALNDGEQAKSEYITGVGVELTLSEDDRIRIQDAMYSALSECGSCPSNRFLRIAFEAACKRIGVTVRHEINEQPTPERSPK